MNFKNLRDKIVNYLIRSYLGDYVEEWLLERITLGFRSGICNTENIKLNIEGLNAKSKEYKLPIEFVACSIDVLSTQFRLKGFAATSITAQVKGLKIVVQTKERHEDDIMLSSMFDSMMTSSFKLAEDCLNSKTEDNEDCDDFDWPNEGIGGVHRVAKVINTVFQNLEINFIDTSLKIEYVPDAGSPGRALEIKIASIQFLMKLVRVILFLKMISLFLYQKIILLRK
ncbi:autophagy-related protein 2 A [Caerostris extrusa]|uniref:Autophagy-related protein 2 n=1 Tax=Caerostris extrusa TaxID=172846 RepID=A0AAV4MZR9_CAEEX|nr:autophagy-related protein 2 A [Caerostris extrusa]